MNGKNEKKFGIWIDGSRVSNDKLKSYVPSDFEYFMISKLAKNAKHYDLYKYHVSLYTPKMFKELQDDLKKDAF